MKVEGQGIASEFRPVANEAVRPQPDKNEASGKEKIGVEKLKPAHSENDVKAAVDVMNEAMKMSNYHLQFRMHKASGRIQVKVIDSDTDKVVREIPPEKILDCSAKIREMLNHMAGVLVDETI